MTESAPQHTVPETVLSPKGAVANLHILQNTGEGGWALASMQWEGRDSLGIRWNGTPENPIGNPQSRGIPTWFILPDEVAAKLRDPALGGLDESNADVTRVRVRPLPYRIWHGEQQEPLDDEWVMSVTDRTRRLLEIMNPRTGHFMAVHPEQIVRLVRDTVRDLPSGPKHGILELNVQMIFENGQLSLEPVETLSARLDLVACELDEHGYEGRSELLRALIAEARTSLTGSDGALGPWEKAELEYAEAAVNTNFLRLALTCIDKAIAVHNLPDQDYEYGFNYGRWPTGGAPRP